MKITSFHFIVPNRLVILTVKVRTGKVCAGHKNPGFVFGSTFTANKFCMKILLFFLASNLFTYFFVNDVIFFFWEFFQSSLNYFGNIHVDVVKGIIIAIFSYEKSPDVCCIGVFDDDIAYVSHSLDVNKGGGQIDFTIRLRQPGIQTIFPQRVYVTLTSFYCR